VGGDVDLAASLLERARAAAAAADAGHPDGGHGGHGGVATAAPGRRATSVLFATSADDDTSNSTGAADHGNGSPAVRSKVRGS
jgi:GTPase involved in cell partitioning and DNA repair